jgi:hypothetical protein
MSVFIAERKRDPEKFSLPLSSGTLWGTPAPIITSESHMTSYARALQQVLYAIAVIMIQPHLV